MSSEIRIIWAGTNPAYTVADDNIYAIRQQHVQHGETDVTAEKPLWWNWNPCQLIFLFLHMWLLNWFACSLILFKVYDCLSPSPSVSLSRLPPASLSLSLSFSLSLSLAFPPHLSLSLALSLSLSLSLSQSVSLFLSLSLCLSVSLSLAFSLSLSPSFRISLSVALSVSVSLSLSVFLSVSLARSLAPLNLIQQRSCALLSN